ncbi:hypothetical protein OS493_001139 [Desmophyllum pertusum]|uniref:Fucosyltransferase n=1 Tax=Desmophyllum pertusum TaxID=174260 RepID=A0A9X0D5N5_9CNID|nr:hypothetical protein OS493_001139 [Desmophyllum pertusum]
MQAMCQSRRLWGSVGICSRLMCLIELAGMFFHVRCISHKKPSHHTMGRKSFAITFLFCLLLALLWRLEINYYYDASVEISVKNPTKKSIRENTSHRRANQTKPWLIIYWSTYFQEQLHISIVWKKGECPVPCEVTSDRSRASDAKGFIVHARDSQMIPPTESVPWILLTQENPVYTPSFALTNAKFMSKFKLLRSYRLDSDFLDSTFWMPTVAPPLHFKDKNGLIMAAFSNCEPVRTEYMRQLMKFVQDCDYFVDAQLIHALHAGSVPVVMSTNKLDEFLPGNLRHSVIKVRDFKSPRNLSDYLKYLNFTETEYNKYLEWKWKGIGNITGTVIGDYWKPKYLIYCQMCVALSEGRIHKDGLQPITCKARSFED